MTAAVPLDLTTFQERLQRFRAAWKSSQGSEDEIGKCDVVMFVLGTPSDFTVYQKTTAMFSWLLGYEFPETVLIISRSKAAFLTSQRKGVILDTLVAADQSVLVVKREKESGRSAQQFAQIWSLISEGTSGSPKIGMITKDKNEGPMIAEWLGFVQGCRHEALDITGDIGTILATKDQAELQNMRVASQLTSLLMSEQVSKKILATIDEGRRMTHVQLADDIDTFVTNHIGRFRNKLTGNVNLEYVDVCYPPIIQSGGNYSLKPSALSTEDQLSSKGPIICSVGLRYRAYCANIARTLLVDPAKGQEETLGLLQSLQQHIVHKLVPGALLCDIYQEGVAFVRERRPDLEGNMVSNFGFGIGIEFRTPEYLINSRCQRRIEAGMTFNLMVGFQDISSGKGPAYSLMIADTVEVASGGAIFLTEGLSEMRQISFSIKKERAAATGPVTPIIKTRLRNQAAAGIRDESTEKRRREHQKELGKARVKEALERYASVENADGSTKKTEILKFESYRKDTQLPSKELGSNGSLKIFVDKRAETVILPINGLAVPFHINTIKNVTKNDEGDYSYLRINFNSPGRTFGKKNDAAPSIFEDHTAHFVRGITLRTADMYRAQEAFKEIQELKKQVAEREAARKERADLVEQGQLIEVSGRRPARLPDVYIRPGLDGKRLPGDVEIHTNGIRYRSQLKSDQRIDVLFANVKHFFFQPCDHETIVVLHLHLHHPIMVGKKKTRDIQFYREALESMVDETGGGRRTKMRFGDEDEIAQEQEERRRRGEANDEFRSFAEKVVEASRNTLEVDVPFRDLGFSGVPARQNVLMQPTTDCLVHLIEPPFFIATLTEVEVAFLERVVFGLKNFDLVLVFKDHSLPPVHINSIPMTQLEAVKEWLDSVDVYFVESKVNFNWTNIMKTVNEDPIGFYEMGGWTYLQPDEADAAGTEEERSSEYEPDEDEDSEEEESEDDEEEEYEESDEYSDEDEEDESEASEEDEEDAPDWDELEEEARREDERRSAANKRGAVAAPRKAPPAKRR
jgi:nucleosome binding factor SPN SPT16 subunit